MVFMDALGCGDRVLAGDCKLFREFCENILQDLSHHGNPAVANGVQGEDKFGIPPFFIERGESVQVWDSSATCLCVFARFSGPLPVATSSYCLSAPGPASNLFRLLRAMQVSRPLMLEGDPGVGKTSLVSALAAGSGHTLTRINLSEHTVGGILTTASE